MMRGEPSRRTWLWPAVLVAIAAAIDRKRIPQSLGDAEQSAAPAAIKNTRIIQTPQPAPRNGGGYPPALRATPWAPLVIALLAFAGVGAFLWLAPRAAVGGWLLAFLFWSSMPIGSLFALMIHALTGGRWARRFAAVFVPYAGAILLIAVLFIPILVALPQFYPWASGAASAPADVSHLYLNRPFYTARSAGILTFWTIVGLLLPRLAGAAATLVAAIALAIHALIIGIIGLDWILSLEPVFFSTSFGATLAFTQFAAALAWAAVLSPGCEDDTGVADVGGLLLATLLGLTYLNFIAYLVIWYGDLPHKVSWLVHREPWPWRLLGLLSFILGAAAPILLLFLERVRSRRIGLRFVGIVALTGIALYYAYLTAPPFGELSLAAALVAAIAIGGLLMAYTATPWARSALQKWGARDGS